jgi:hypothetical protein
LAVKKIYPDGAFGKQMKDYVDQYLNERMNSGKDYYLNQRDKVDLVEKMNETKVDLIDRLNRNFNILIGTLLTVGGTIIVLAINILNKLP